MNPLRLTETLAGIALAVLFCFMSNDDYTALDNNASYTAEIMQKAKEDALADARFNRLRAMGDDMLALQEVN